MEGDLVTGVAIAVQRRDLPFANQLIEQAAINGVITPKQKAIALIKNEEVISKLIQEDSINEASELGFSTWQLSRTKDDPDGNLNAGFKAIQDTDLSSSDKDAAESVLKRRVLNRRAEDKIALEERKEADLGGINELQYEVKDYEAATQAVFDSSLSESERRPLLKELEARARLALAGEAERDDPVAIDAVSTAIARVGSDLQDLKSAKKVIADNQHLLKSTTAAQAWKDINEEFDKSTGNAYARVRSDTRQKAIGKSETTLDLLIQALTGTKGKERKGLEDKITTAREKFNLELANFNKWEESMRAWRRKNADAEPEAIQKEGVRSWNTEFKTRDIDELRRRAEPVKEAPKSEEKKTSKTDPDKKIKVISPTGKTGTVPAKMLDKVLKLGWKKI
jgi:hypothetical protein